VDLSQILIPLMKQRLCPDNVLTIKKFSFVITVLTHVAKCCTPLFIVGLFVEIFPQFRADNRDHNLGHT
jgi:hypothetical protein